MLSNATLRIMIGDVSVHGRRIVVKTKARGDFLLRVAHATADVPEAELGGPRVLRVLLNRLADNLLPTDDPLVHARLRGLLAMRELLNANGGALSADDVRTMLGISRQAVDKRRRAGRLLAVELPRRGLFYPAWQFTPAGSTLSGMTEILAALRKHQVDGWAQLRFFLSLNDRLGGRRPIDVIGEGDVDAVLEAVGAFDEHGAA